MLVKAATAIHSHRRAEVCRCSLFVLWNPFRVVWNFTAVHAVTAGGVLASRGNGAATVRARGHRLVGSPAYVLQVLGTMKATVILEALLFMGA